MHAILWANIGEAIGNYIVKALAVAGGFVIGYVGSLLAIWILGRLAFNRKIPRQVRLVVSGTGGVLLAVIVFLLLFFSSGGGGGWGFGPGFGFGSGQGTGDGVEGRAPDEPTSTPITRPELPEPIVPTPEIGAAPPLQILMLGGERVRQIGNEFAYYQIQPDGTTHTFDGIRKLIRDRMRVEPPVRGIVIIIREESVARNHLAVRRLEEFAKDERLAVTHDLPK